MDSNRDDAKRCLDLAAVALKAGEVEKASRLLEKSQRMFPLSDAQNDLANEIARAQNGFKSSSSSTSNASTHAKTARSSRASSDAAPSPPRPATAEMEAAVASIHRKREGSHYEVLEVTRDADENALKRSYRKLALRLHPDRNFAKGADEAFKRVSHAFDVLSDPQRRSHYDTFGTDDPGQPQTRRTNRGNANVNPFTNASDFDQFVHVNGGFSPDEIFTFLFNGDPRLRAQFMHGGVRRRRQRRHSEGDDNGNRTNGENTGGPSENEREAREEPQWSEIWGRLRPLVWLVVMIIISGWISGENSQPSYSLHQTGYYSASRTTRNGVPFFVKGGKTLSQMEEQRMWHFVDRSALEQFRMRCEGEEEEERRLKYQSTSWLNSKRTRKHSREQLIRHQKPWCEQFTRLLMSIRRNG